MLQSILLTALLSAGSVLGAGTQCSPDSKCPKDSPCCSTYGECGVGAYCLGGCDPMSSFSLDACVPGPVCQDRSMKLNSLDRVADISEYLGDASKADWVAQGEPLIYNNNLLLTMPKDSVGTVLSSTVYLWYGNVKAKFKTSRGAGVVTAFILFSDVKDEIDFEFVGVDLDTAQTNYYFQGITDYHNSGNISVSDTFDDWHTYEVRWTPDKIDWVIDGKVGRTKLRADTWNDETKNFDFPQTPARVQLSIWPGGLASNNKGTVDWAGGEIDWNAPDIQNYGYYFATFSEVDIECYNSPTAPGTNKNTGYYYDNIRCTNDTVVDGDKSTIIASLQASGLDPNKGKKTATKSSSSKTSTSDDSSESSEPASIPGGGNGSSGDDHSDDDSSNNNSSNNSNDNDSSSSNNSGSSSNNANSSNCKSSSFNQDCGSDSTSEHSSNGKSGSSKASASALAIIIAGCALFWL
ncbi:concanavalin A-like lectin/glucanase domain-containing protein [Mariannaea sp. PMI_226]|nr:concanavalin A-like lectin/glucanase domain-containing protein [Mariannaea sp. PMI_226]